MKSGQVMQVLNLGITADLALATRWPLRHQFRSSNADSAVNNLRPCCEGPRDTGGGDGLTAARHIHQMQHSYFSYDGEVLKIS